MTFIRSALPPSPAHVLEVGAGNGDVAEELAGAGYVVTAIDPASEAPNVIAVALHEFEAPAASFDAAVAVVSLHHVEPLPESCRRLAQLIRTGGKLVVDEFDIERFDETAAAWWLDQRPAEADDWLARRIARGGGPLDAAAIVADRRSHLHSLRQVREALDPWFRLTEPARGPYLYRWNLPPECRAAEEQLIAADQLPVLGARFTGTRR